MRARVIVPLDGTSDARRAVRVGGWLARQRDANLVVMRVVRHARAVHDAAEEIDAALAVAGDMGQALVTNGPDLGDVAEAILVEADRTPGSLICFATHGARRLAAASPHATTTALLHRARCPLVLVGPSCEFDAGPAKALVACLDGTEHAERVLPVVGDLAVELDLDLWLAQIAPCRVSDDLGVLGDVDEAAYLRRCARSLSRPVSNWDVLHGRDPARAIVELCAEHPGVVPVLATHGRTGAQLLLHGSVALRVAHTCTVPVVVVPAGATAEPVDETLEPVPGVG